MKRRTKLFATGRREQRFADAPSDPYAIAGKLPGNAACSRCGAVYREGRWQWQTPGDNPEPVLCMACRRIQDGIPAGYLSIDDVRTEEQRDEMVRLIRHHETRARLEHPMQRVMAIEQTPERVVVTTTDVHLARDLAKAVQAAFGERMRLAYSKGEQLLRAYRRS